MVDGRHLRRQLNRRLRRLPPPRAVRLHLERRRGLAGLSKIYISRRPMPLNILECQVSKMVNSDTCPRPTTGLVLGVRLADALPDVRVLGASEHLGDVRVVRELLLAEAEVKCEVQVPGRLATGGKVTFIRPCIFN